MTAIYLLAALAQGFTEPPPEAYLDPVDQQIARTGIGLPGRPRPCLRQEMGGGVKFTRRTPTEQCFKLQPAQRWRGLWRNALEGSEFCPAPAATCGDKRPGERIWLSERPERRPDGKLYMVDFIGRKTIHKGSFGHFGTYDHEIVMDRMIIYGEFVE